jgi:DNA-binding NarL/FixJ family response regulator
MTDQREITVIIADDHPIVREGLRDFIEQQSDIRVVAEAGDGQEAYDLVALHCPTVALLDMSMPGMSGLEVAERVIRERLPSAVILLTMHDHPGLLEKAIDIGVAGYILKDSTPLDIARGIRCVAAGEPYFSPTLAGGVLRSANVFDPRAEQRLGLYRLTPMERRILRLIAEEKATSDIAAELSISPRTVEKHRSHMLAKLGLKGANAVLRFALDNRKHL